MTDLLWFCPVYYGAPITQTFAQHPSSGKGVDFGIPNGTAVMAMRGGRVAQVTDQFPLNHHDANDGYANRMVVDHGSISGTVWASWYAHLYPGTMRVKIGDLVKTGQEIALSDNCGSSTGPHLHAMVKRGNTAFDWWPFVRYSVKEVDTGMPAFTVPVFPALVRAKVITTAILNIRQRPNATAKDVGDINPGTILDVIGGTWVGTDYWIKIGFEQYAAAYYQGNTWVEFI